MKQVVSLTAVVILLVASSLVQARDYVPPPTGPYQSSVVINNNQKDDSQQQFYKFPPADILIDDKDLRDDKKWKAVGEADTGDNLPMASQPAQIYGMQQPPYPGNYSPWQQQQPSGFLNDNQANFNAPQWYGYQRANPNINQNNWQQAPGYGYQQNSPYMYGYPNQYNSQNNLFNGMPSPWSAMSKNPFFSDR